MMSVRVDERATLNWGLLLALADCIAFWIVLMLFVTQGL